RRLSLWVRDEGVGMTDVVRDRLFERFYRGPDLSGPGEVGGVGAATPARDGVSETAMSQHLGLGLAIVEALVRAPEGRVEVQSAPGSGSRFTVHLPS
ncbi:MAG: ATP-binding protein, partial [Thermoleophilia bacterium]